MHPHSATDAGELSATTTATTAIFAAGSVKDCGHFDAMKRLLALLLVIPIAFAQLPAEAQISVIPQNFPLEAVANAVVEDPSLIELFLPQIIDALVESPEEIVPLGISLLSDPAFMEKMIDVLPSLSQFLPYIFTRLPEILQNLPYIMETFLPNADAIINSLVITINERPDTVSKALSSLIPAALENVDVIVGAFAFSLPIILSYTPQLVEIFVELSPVLPAVVSQIDLEGLSALLLSYLPQISDALVYFFEGLSEEQIAQISDALFYLLQVIPGALPELISAALILLLSPGSIFTALFALITSISLQDMLRLIPSIFRLFDALLRTALVFLSRENMEIIFRTSISAVGSMNLREVMSAFRENQVEINGALVPRWVIS
ncbi:MAG: hypothetical protein SVE93_00990 [Candidatus Thermoplasmatota archaeon]|nr:hypothetical protein [Candidatus Thermoplasmatota archaeon]